MALSSLEQTTTALAGASRVLIAPAADPSGDVLAGSLALGLALEAAGKDACVLLPADVPARYEFLPRPGKVSREIPFDRQYVLSIDTRVVPISELRYERTDDALRLYLTAPVEFTRDHIALEAGGHRHDLVVTVGVADLEALGPTLERNSHAFFDVAVLNVDRGGANVRFGSINHVDVAAATMCEVMHEIIERWSEELLTESVATCLLAGIVDGTQSFQNPTVTPRTMSAASKLMARGARQNDVVRHLYKSRPLAQLRLWGFILGALEEREEFKVAYATLAPEDLTALEYDPRELARALGELHENFPHFMTIVVFTLSGAEGEDELLVRGLVSSRDEGVLERIARNYRTKRRGTLMSFRLGVPELEGAPAAFFRECFDADEADAA